MAARHEIVTYVDHHCHNHLDSVRGRTDEPGSAFLYENDRGVARASDGC
jgi:hypothetical protein